MAARILFFILLLLTSFSARSQENRLRGIIRSVDGSTVVAEFDDGVMAGVGDEVEFIRIEEIVDPVTGNVRGHRTRTIGNGIVQDIGLGGALINVTDVAGNFDIIAGDRAELTGEVKNIARPSAPQFGDIQEISNDRITTTLGLEDNISEGDIFLIQRMETTGDTTSNQPESTGVNVGRMSIDTVRNGESEGRIIEMSSQPLLSDRVVRESDYLAWRGTVPAAATAPADTLQMQLDALRSDIDMLRARIDSIETEQDRQRDNFDVLRRDIERVVDLFMSGDIPETVMRLKNDEPAAVEPVNDLMHRYELALDACLSYRFDAAIDGFESILRDYPGSRLIENCRYWIAQSKYAMRRYRDAAAGFRAVLDDRRFTHKDDDASIMLAVTYFQMNDIERAIEQFQRFLDDYPESEFTAKIDFWIDMLAES